MVVAIMLAPTVVGDHIRVLTAGQTESHGLSVVIRWDFNYSGNCCGGAINFYPEGDPDAGATSRYGYIPDGVESGQYIGDAVGSGTFDNDPADTTYTWERWRPDPAEPLVRIEVTYSYPAQGTYDLFWHDCCPHSEGHIQVVAGGPPTQTRILAIETGQPSLVKAFTDASIAECATGESFCYEVVSADPLAPVNFYNVVLDAYDVLLVGTNANADALNALNARTDLGDWTRRGGGVVAYGQTGASAWAWVPSNGGGVLSSVVASSSFVDMTAKGLTHRAYLNQVPGTPVADSTLSNWGPSRVNYFNPGWPAHYDVDKTRGPGPLARDASGNAVTLAGAVGLGCTLVSGQPVDSVAAGDTDPASGAAMWTFRSTLSYGATCSPEEFL